MLNYAELSKMNMWSQLNKLSPNTTKSKCIVFIRQKKTLMPVIKINQNELENVETFNFLSVKLDTKYSWKLQYQPQEKYQIK